MIGLIPAAGKAIRMGGIPKFLLPTPEGSLLDVMISRMASVAHKPYIMTTQIGRDLLWDYANVRTVNTTTMNETVLAARHVCGDENVAFGMPDTYFEDKFAFDKLKYALESGADWVVGLFNTRPDQRSKSGMCDIAGDQVIRLEDKPQKTDMTLAWGVMAWRPGFWKHIKAGDLHVGYAVARAIEDHASVHFAMLDGGYWDCGTPEEFFALIRYLTPEGVR